MSKEGDGAPGTDRGWWLAAAAIAVLSLVAYAPVSGFEFLTWDDDDYVYENEHVAAGLSAASVRWAFASFHSANWHPLTWLSHILDCELFGLEAGAHHLVNSALHALNAVLLCAVLLAATRALWPSAFVAALFAVHPLRVQSVAWLSERKDLLAGLFFLLCLWAWVRYARRPSPVRYSLSLAALAAGLMAKPMLVTTPFVLLLVDRWPLERWTAGARRRLILEKVPFLALALASSVVTFFAQRAGRAIASTETFDVGTRIANAVQAYGTYLAKGVWPEGLAYYYPHPAVVDPEWSPLSASVWGAAALLALLTAFALWTLRSGGRAYVGVGWGWFVGMLVPVVGLLQVGDQAWADRYAYLPLIGVQVAVAWGARDFVRAHPAAQQPVLAAAVLTIGAAAIGTHRQVEHWRDSEALYRRALAVTERNYRAHVGLGNLHLRAGASDAARREYEAALAIKADDAGALFNYGILEQRAGALQRAAQLHEAAIAADPGWPLPYLNLAKTAIDLGQLERAEEVLRALLELAPGDANAHFNLGLIRASASDFEAAVEHFRAAVAGDPDFHEAHRALGTLLLEDGDHRAALRHFEAACDTETPHPQAAAKLAWILAATPDADRRDAARALEWARWAVAATEGRDLDALEAQAAAHAALGQLDEAVSAQTQALGLAPLGSPDRRGDVAARLKLYQAGEAYRLP